MADEQAQEYGRKINDLKEQYRDELGDTGDPNLTDAAAKIRAGQEVYGNEPTEKQEKLLTAADIQRQEGLSQQMTADYEERGVDAELAQGAGDIRARQEVLGKDLSEKQENLVATADEQAGSLEGPKQSMDAEIAGNAEKFMDTASKAGVTTSVGGTEVAEGNNYTISQTAGITVVENQETGGAIASQDGEVLSSEGMTPDDQDRFQRLSQVSAEQLQPSVQQPETQQKSSQRVELG